MDGTDAAMNKKPVSYKQGDQRWGGKPYRVPGETSTIASAGCGPTCAAMAIAALKDQRVTPETTCAWSVSHGYKALKQGTYYSYFKPQLAAYGIDCRRRIRVCELKVRLCLRQQKYIYFGVPNKLRY